jgi:hypothetical protein
METSLMGDQWYWQQRTPPPNRRVFGERFKPVVEELKYVYNKVSYWLYARRSQRHANRYRARLAELISRSRRNPAWLTRIQSQAVLADLEGDPRRAARHLERKLHIMHVEIAELDHPGTPHSIRLLRKHAFYDWRAYGRLAEIYAKTDRLIEPLQCCKDRKHSAESIASDSKPRDF